jgi:hypothetical protein
MKRIRLGEGDGGLGSPGDPGIRPRRASHARPTPRNLGVGVIYLTLDHDYHDNLTTASSVSDVYGFASQASRYDK